MNKLTPISVAVAVLAANVIATTASAAGGISSANFGLRFQPPSPAARYYPPEPTLRRYYPPNPTLRGYHPPEPTLRRYFPPNPI